MVYEALDTLDLRSSSKYFPVIFTVIKLIVMYLPDVINQSHTELPTPHQDTEQICMYTR